MIVEARAKINWTLDITGQREDGYHMMDMLMQPITLSDMLTIKKADRITMTLDGNQEIPVDASNLVWRAAEALRTYTGYTGGAAIHVSKRIPSGAGLGGGSADAAGTLVGLNSLWQLGLSQSELEAIGLTLGADVPFCLRGGLAHVTGIGQIMQPLDCAPEWPLVIIQPCEGLSTGAVFRAYHAAAQIHRPDTAAATAALCSGDLQALSLALGNALESVSCAARPDIMNAIVALREQGAICAAMSGSGSAVFGAFASNEAAKAAFDCLKERWEKTYLCASCIQSVLIHE